MDSQHWLNPARRFWPGLAFHARTCAPDGDADQSGDVANSGKRREKADDVAKPEEHARAKNEAADDLNGHAAPRDVAQPN